MLSSCGRTVNDLSCLFSDSLILQLLRLLSDHVSHTLGLLSHSPRLLSHPVLPGLVFLVSHLQFPQPPVPLVHALLLRNLLLVLLALHAVLLPVHISCDQYGDCEGLGVQTSAEVHVGRLVVAFPHRAGCADNGPDGQTAAEGHEGLFAEAAPYLVEGVFIVEVAG